MGVNNGQKVIIRDLYLQGKASFSYHVYIGAGGVLELRGTARVTGNTNTAYQTSAYTASNNGGGIYVQGGTLRMFDSSSVINNTVRYNNSYDDPWTTTSVYGGGVYLTGSAAILEMRDSSTISGNTAAATAVSGTINTSGGGIYNSGGTVRIEGGTISGNTASTGSSYAGTGTIQRGTFDANGNWTSLGNLSSPINTDITIVNGVQQ